MFIPDMRFMKHDLEVAIQAASQAGEYIQSASKTLKKKSLNEGKHLLPSLRKESEQSIISVLRKYKSQDSISSELLESSWHDTPERQWIIEPLSSPLGLLYGSEEDISAVMISLREEMYTRLSVLFFPKSETLYHAELGKGTERQHQPIDLRKKQRIKFADTHIDLQQLPHSEQETEFFKKADFALRSDIGASMTTRHMQHAGMIAKLLEEDTYLSGIVQDAGSSQASQNPWEKVCTQLLLSEAGGTTMNERYKEPHPLANEPFIQAVSTDIARSILQLVKKVEWEPQGQLWKMS